MLVLGATPVVTEDRYYRAALLKRHGASNTRGTRQPKRVVLRLQNRDAVYLESLWAEDKPKSLVQKKGGTFYLYCNTRN